MRKIIVIPDSFKGTLDSADACGIVKDEIKSVFPDCDVIAVPVADGGEGTVDCFLSALGGKVIELEVSGPLFSPVTARYAVLPDGRTAVVEMASCAGLALVGENKNPLITTTRGVGELISDAAMRGCRKIIVGLGGSATNDAGCGMASALGYRFYDKEGNLFIPVGGTLCDIGRIEGSADPCLAGVEITVVCDVVNPLYGPTGAAYVFAPQKGADSFAVALLDKGLRHAAAVMLRDLGADVSTIQGGGAAGGLGAGMCAFLGAKLERGIEVILDTVGFDKMLEGADLVITGEGRLDSQSLGGKAVIGIAGRAAARGVPVVAVVGGYDKEIQLAYDRGLTAVFAINRLPEDLSVSAPKTKENLALALRNILRLIRAVKG